MNNKEVIEYLFDVCQSNLALKPNSEPDNLQSTNALDSVLYALIHIVKENAQTKDCKSLFETLHLATGTRTPFVQEVLTYVIKHQSKETILCDAVEFFQEALERLVFVEH